MGGLERNYPNGTVSKIGVHQVPGDSFVGEASGFQGLLEVYGGFLVFLEADESDQFRVLSELFNIYC